MRKFTKLLAHFSLMLSISSLNSCNDKDEHTQKSVDKSDFSQISLIEDHVWHLQSNVEVLLNNQNGKKYVKFSNPKEVVYVHHQFTPKTNQKYTLKLPIKPIGNSGTINVKINYAGHCSTYPNDASEVYYQLLEGQHIVVSIDHLFQFDHNCSKITLKAANALRFSPVTLEIGAPLIVRR